MTNHPDEDYDAHLDDPDDDTTGYEEPVDEPEDTQDDSEGEDE